MTAATPPDTLFYGVAQEQARLVSINGLRVGEGQRVTLYADPASARQSVAADSVTVFRVYAGAAYSEGSQFWHLPDGTWQTQALESDLLYLPPIRGAE